jgi:hypothetical protein
LATSIVLIKKLGIIKGKLKSDVDISAKLQFSTDFVPKMYLIAS